MPILGGEAGLDELVLTVPGFPWEDVVGMS